MRRIIILLSTVAVTMAASAATAFAVPASAYYFRGETVDAFFSKALDECVSEFVYVSAYDATRFRPPPGEGTAGPSAAFVQISRLDFCDTTGPEGEPTEVWAATGSTALQEGALAVDRRLNFATLDTTAQLEDTDGDVLTVEVSLDWAGSGIVERFAEKSSYKIPGFVFKGRAKGAQSFATASGSVSDGTTDFVAATDTSEGAYISRLRSRTVVRGNPPPEPPEEEGIPAQG